jgi:hypothetical protein
MTYLIIAFILLVVYAYFATWIDEWFEIDSLGSTLVIGFVACALWPLTLGLATLIVPLLLIMRWGAKRRGDNF